MKPEDPVAFFTETLSRGVSMKAELDALKKELEDLRGKVTLYTFNLNQKHRL